MNKLEKQTYEEVANQPNCYFNNKDCNGWFEIHHIFRGKNRNNSTKYGMMTKLCKYHHDNMTPEQDLELKQHFQRKFEAENDIDFIDVFRRNYL